MRYRKRLITWAIIFVALILVYLYFVVGLLDPILQQNANTLALGSNALLDSLSIPIRQPEELDFKTKDEILALRQEAVMQYPWLLYTTYEPSHAVFSEIVGNAAWWGWQGHFYYGSGEKSIEGPSEETRYILNPYLLVAADFSGLSIWSGRPGEVFWNNSTISPQGLEAGKIPFYTVPEGLTWWPKRPRAEVTYNLSAYLVALNHWTARKMTVGDATFDLVAYNARDLNLNYLYVSYTDSIYISKDNAPKEAFYITQYLHRGDSCGYQGGCNNMSPETQEMMDIHIVKLPAKAIIYLWKDRPSSVSAKPDFTYVINIK